MRRTFGRRTFDFGQQVAVMAIVNRTPDSFYDRGATFGFEAAVAAAERAVAEGADWVDIGGGKAGPRPAGGAGWIVSHPGAPPRTRPPRAAYDDVVAEVRAFLLDRAALARRHGVPAERLVIDPGHDFHKNTFHSLELTRRLEELTGLGYPLLVACSNKDFIGETLDLPLDERLEGSLAAAVVSVLKGADLVRVHQVGPTVRAVRMTEAILGRRPPAATRRGLA